MGGVVEVEVVSVGDEIVGEDGEDGVAGEGM